MEYDMIESKNETEIEKKKERRSGEKGEEILRGRKKYRERERSTKLLY